MLNKLFGTIYRRYIRPVRKYFKRKKYIKEQKILSLAIGELIYKFEPLIIVILNETLEDFDSTVKQNHYTRLAQEQIRKIFESKIKRFTASVK